MLVGILVDVSGSMKNSAQVHVKPSDEDITRAQSIFTTIMNIVNREVSFEDDHKVFVLAFGLLDVATCDLFALLEYVQTLEVQTHGNGYTDLSQLLKSLGASNVDQYIRRYVTEKEAQFISNFHSENREDLRNFVEESVFSREDHQHYGNGRMALIKLLESEGVSIAENFVEQHVSEEQAQFLFKIYSKNYEERRKFVEDFVFSERDRRDYGNGHKALIKLLASNGAPSAEKYVIKYVSEDQAQFLFKFYSRNIKDLEKVVHDLPAVCKRQCFRNNFDFQNGFTGGLAIRLLKTSIQAGYQASVETGLTMKNAGSHFGVCDDADTIEKKATEEQVIRAIESSYDSATRYIINVVNDHVNHSMRNFKHLLRQPILRKLQTMVKPKSKNFQSTVNLLKQVAVTSSDSSTTPQSVTSTQLSALADSMEPFIYGDTPMCEALKSALHVFCSDIHGQKILFLLSDGESTDGDPTQFTRQLRENNVLVFTCLLTSQNISNPRELYYKADSRWTKAQRKMFELSSTMENSHSAMSILLEKNWELPASGHSHLFIQANHPDVIKEYSNVIQYMTDSNDVVLNMIGRVSLDMYINAAISTFQPKLQIGGTCYAHAVATVFHLAMRRIEGRENGVPDFVDICQELIKEYGRKGAVTESVLNTYAPKYRLHYKKVDELGARQAINRRRPVVATIRLDDKQWDDFSEFYRRNPQGSLEAKDLRSPTFGAKLKGHAVVLMKCDPTSLIFINSWGPKFADGGFFRVRNQAVLNLQFYDVYWIINDLKQSEIEAFRAKSSATGQNLLQKLPAGIQNLLYECPECHESSRVSAYITNLLEAECPICHKHFKPTPLGLNVSVCAN